MLGFKMAKILIGEKEFEEELADIFSADYLILTAVPGVIH